MIVGLSVSGLSLLYPSWSCVLRVRHLLAGRWTPSHGSTPGAVRWPLLVHQAKDESDEINVSERTSFREKRPASNFLKRSCCQPTARQPVGSLRLRHPRSSYADRDLVRRMPPIAAVCPRSCWKLGATPMGHAAALGKTERAKAQRYL